jgi:hypothetical protein
MSDGPPLEFVSATNQPKIVNHVNRASAIYFLNSKRIMVVAEDFDDAHLALTGLKIRVEAHHGDD